MSFQWNATKSDGAAAHSDISLRTNRSGASINAPSGSVPPTEVIRARSGSFPEQPPFVFLDAMREHDLLHETLIYGHCLLGTRWFVCGPDSFIVHYFSPFVVVAQAFNVHKRTLQRHLRKSD
nr:hypothetical protein [Burkholderia ambifaria]